MFSSQDSFPSEYNNVFSTEENNFENVNHPTNMNHFSEPTNSGKSLIKPCDTENKPSVSDANKNISCLHLREVRLMDKNESQVEEQEFRIETSFSVPSLQNSGEALGIRASNKSFLVEQTCQDVGCFSSVNWQTYKGPLNMKTCSTPAIYPSRKRDVNFLVIPKSRSPFLRCLKREARFYFREGCSKDCGLISLLYNYFNMEFPHEALYRYEIVIENALGLQDSKNIACQLNKQSMNKIMKNCDILKGINPILDGKNLLIRQSLEICNPVTVTVTIEEECVRRFSVTVKPLKENQNTCAIQLEPFHLLLRCKKAYVPKEGAMAIECALKNTPALWHVGVCRPPFAPFRSELSLRPNRKIWRGYRQNDRIGHWEPFLNEKVESLFNERVSVLDFIEEVFGTDLRKVTKVDDSLSINLSKELGGLKVMVIHLPQPRKYRICRVTLEKPSNLLCRVGRGVEKETAIDEYFLTKYNYKLLYPNLPCLQMKPEQKTTYFPMEVCYLAKNQYSRKIWANHTANMVKMSSSYLQELNVNSGTNKKPNVSDKSAEDVCRESNVEQLETSPEKILNNPASDICNLQKLFPVGDTGDWILLSFVSLEKCSTNRLKAFSKKVSKVAEALEIPLGSPVRIETFCSEFASDNVLDTIRMLYPTVTFAIVVLSRNDYFCRESKCTERADVIIQFVKAKNMMKRNLRLILQNFYQRLFMRTNGMNNLLLSDGKSKLFEKPFMIFGADVSHHLKETERHIVATVVGSLDHYPFCYGGTISTQTTLGKESVPEYISDLKSMVKNLLVAFSKVNGGLLPESIIFYRKAVGDGSFLKVLAHELSKLRDACKEVHGELYQPGITYVILQKHPYGNLRMDGSSGSPIKPTDVGYPFLFHFFLSHTLMPGTSRSVHYFVLWDDNRFRLDDLKKVTYYMCHVHAFFKRLFFIPVPVQYAHQMGLAWRQHWPSSSEIASENIKTYRLEEMEVLRKSKTIVNNVYLV